MEAPKPVAVAVAEVSEDESGSDVETERFRDLDYLLWKQARKE